MRQETATTGRQDELLERSSQLAALGEILAAVGSTRSGRLVLVGGEAGVGKTALVRRFCDGTAAGARALGRVRRAVHAAAARPAARRGRATWAASSRSSSAAGRAAAPGRRRDRPRARGAGRRPRARGSPLGRRGDARRAASARPPDRDRPGAGDRDLPRRRARPRRIRCSIVLGELAPRPSVERSARAALARGGCASSPRPTRSTPASSTARPAATRSS